MTLLDEVKHYLARNAECLDILYLRLATKSEIADSSVHITEMRWGNIFGTVLHRSGEYVMVTEYIYNEGADGGEVEVDAYTVEPREVIKTIWEAT